MHLRRIAAAWNWTDNDPEARSNDYDGKPDRALWITSLCPSYRGKDYRKWIEELRSSACFPNTEAHGWI